MRSSPTTGGRPSASGLRRREGARARDRPASSTHPTDLHQAGQTDKSGTLEAKEDELSERASERPAMPMNQASNTTGPTTPRYHLTFASSAYVALERELAIPIISAAPNPSFSLTYFLPRSFSSVSFTKPVENEHMCPRIHDITLSCVKMFVVEIWEYRPY